MSYPDICTMYCRKWGTMDCPNSGKCLETVDKPYFMPKQKQSRWDRLRRWWRKHKHCRQAGYNCPDCIYHKYIFEDSVFRGIRCLIDGRKL